MWRVDATVVFLDNESIEYSLSRYMRGKSHQDVRDEFTLELPPNVIIKGFHTLKVKE